MSVGGLIVAVGIAAVVLVQFRPISSREAVRIADRHLVSRFRPAMRGEPLRSQARPDANGWLVEFEDKETGETAFRVQVSGGGDAQVLFFNPAWVRRTQGAIGPAQP